MAMDLDELQNLAERFESRASADQPEVARWGDAGMVCSLNRAGQQCGRGRHACDGACLRSVASNS